MESASAPGTVDHSPAQDHDLDLSPLTDDGHEISEDKDVLSSNQVKPPRLATDGVGLYADDMIGVSIGRVQTHMRSPETPDVEKARALNLTLDTFHRILTLEEEDDESDDQRATKTQSEPQPKGRGVNATRSSVEERSTVPSEKASSPQRPLTSKSDAGYHERGKQDERYDKRGSPEVSISTDDPNISPPSSRGGPFPSLVRRPENGTRQGEVAEESSRSWYPHRMSITKSLLAAAGHDGRRRASAGPGAIMSNLRKLLPDLPSTSFHMSSISLLQSNSKQGGSRSEADSPIDSPRDNSSFSWLSRPTMDRRKLNEEMPPTRLDRSSSLLPPTVSSSSHGLDGNVESLLAPVSPASTKGSRARSNSESSLYIGRRVSGVSAYDDISAFANVTDMANSRFKAITDSFQNSTLRLPKLPMIRPSPKPRMSREDITEVPRGLPDTAANDTQSPDYQYTTIKKMRNGKKGFDVETPQQRAHPILAGALSKLTGDVVVLGGYRGSILRSAHPPHRQVWVPIKVGLNIRKVDLEVGLSREDEERMEEHIIPSGVLSHIGPIDICRRLLKHMRKCPNARESKLRVHEWGYDWRLSPDLLSARLIKFLESLECNRPETPAAKRGATVVAHSLGGLITRHAVNQRPDLFAGVVYAGVPQHCVNILGPMRNGDDVLLSSRVLTAQVNFTLRTSYALLPENGRCFIQKHTNKRYDLDFFDADVWEEHRLSPCINPPLPSTTRDERRKSIMGAISEAISSNRRVSWFGDPSSTSAEPGQMMEAAGQNVADKAANAGHAVENNAEELVEPTMKQSQHRPTVATTSTIPKDAAKEYLRRTLAETLAFKQQLVFNPSHQEKNIYPPHAYIFGKTVPTVYGARVASEEAIKYDDAFDDLAFAAGDGVVLASAAQLPEGYRCVKGGRVESDRGHVGLMGDLEGMGRCLEAVVIARARGSGLGKGVTPHSQSSSASDS